MVSETQLYKIEVTKEDIEKGFLHADNCKKCPVALAMKRQIPTIRVGCSTAYAENRKVVFFLPQEVSDNITEMLKGKKVEPFNFEVIGNVYS